MRLPLLAWASVPAHDGSRPVTVGGRPRRRLHSAPAAATWTATAMMVAAGATVLILALIAPRVQDIVTRDQMELDEAFALVRESMRPGDIIAAFSPPAASIELGRVDYYAQEHGAEAFIRSGEQVGIWPGTPVISSARCWLRYSMAASEYG